jgi:hypothetical protein
MKEKKITMTKTSISHPLRIDEVKAPDGGGIIGMTLCPGKKINSAQSGPWNRDLEIDLQAIQSWGAQALVNLMEGHEYELLHYRIMWRKFVPIRWNIFICRLLMFTRPMEDLRNFGKAPGRD